MNSKTFHQIIMKYVNTHSTEFLLTNFLTKIKIESQKKTFLQGAI